MMMSTGSLQINLGLFEPTLLALYVLAAILLIALYRKTDAQWWTPFVHGIFFAIVTIIAGACGVSDKYTNPALFITLCTVVGYYVFSISAYVFNVVRRSMRMNRLWSAIPRDQRRRKPHWPWTPFNEAWYDTAHSTLGEMLQNAQITEGLALLEELTEEHLITLSRKRIQCAYKDEYEILRDGDWPKHAKYFIKAVAIPAMEAHGLTVHPPLKAMLELLNDIVPATASLDDQTTETQLHEHSTGSDYEMHVARILEEADWQAKMTPVTGDHGADIIAIKGSFQAAIQCKYYSQPVGNGSVQEAYSAKGFYRCDVGAVVSNASFTKAARTAATSLNVPLLHHDDLVETLEKLRMHALT
jgi:restriction system protein